MKRKLCIIITVISILLTTVYADATPMNDAQKSDLYNLGIMVGDEDGDLRLTDTITRAEAVKIICTAGNISTDKAYQNVFPDVAESHWAYKFICAAKSNGIINGDENGNFNPEANITNEEIVKMIVSLLGYDPLAVHSGGYPAGYTMAGTRIGVTKGMQLDISTPAIRNDVGIMICNALDIPIMMENPYSPDGSVEYIIMDGATYSEKITLRIKLLDKNTIER